MIISLIKLFNKRELEVTYRECRNRSQICSLTALTARSAGGADFLRGKASAYKEMADFIEKRKRLHEL